jgi:prepilin peptidase CpaA
MTHAAILIMLGSAAWTDWRHRKIPNPLVFTFMLIGFLMQLSKGQAMMALGGVAAAFSITLLPVLLRGMGMGDQKLLMALGAWTSYSEIYDVVVWSLVSCLFVLFCSPQAWRRLAENMYLLSAGWTGHRTLWLPAREHSALSLPYAVHLFAAYLLTLWMG